MPAESAFGFSVSSFDVHPTGAAVTQCSVSTTLYLALEASYYFPVVAGVNAGDLAVLVLVVDDGKPLHHAWVNPAGLVRYRVGG